MRYYVSIADVEDATLAFLGYHYVAEEDGVKLYTHFGDDILVDAADPFIMVDDLNDVALIKGSSDVVGIPDN